jgi:hypothetical protein
MGWRRRRLRFRRRGAPEKSNFESTDITARSAARHRSESDTSRQAQVTRVRRAELAVMKGSRVKSPPAIDSTATSATFNRRSASATSRRRWCCAARPTRLPRATLYEESTRPGVA